MLGRTGLNFEYLMLRRSVFYKIDTRDVLNANYETQRELEYNVHQT